MKKIIEFFVHRNLFNNIVTIAIIIAGAIALSNMKREAFPKVDFDIVTMVTVNIGASPFEIEKFITKPLEDEIRSIDGIKRLDSSSLNSRSAVVATLDPDLDDKDEAIQELKDAVDRAKIDFPERAEEPVVTEVSTKRTPIIEIAISRKNDAISATTTQTKIKTKKISELELRSFAKTLAEKVETLSDVAQVVKRGYRDREFHVAVNPEKMAIFNVSAEEVSNALVAHNVNFPGGTVNDKGLVYNIRTVKEFKNTDEIGEVIIRSNDLGGLVKIKDVTDYINDDFEEKTVIEKSLGQEAIVLTVLKKEDGDAITLVKEVEEILNNFRDTTSDKIEINTFNDMSFFIKRRLNVLTSNVGIGMILVIICLLFFLGWRVSLMVALGVPFAFAITFLLMNYLGVSINLISMFGLIIVSGMLVDDAIIVGENVYRHIEQGVKPIVAAVNGSKEMVKPMLGAISTTMMAFLPLMFMGGIMGKFVWYIPAAVIIALAASLIESFFILPGHLAEVTKGQPIEKIIKSEDSWDAKIMKKLLALYKPTLELALRFRYLLLILTLLMFIGGISLIPAIGFKLFPGGAVEIFTIKTEGPQGIGLEEMNERILKLEKAVSDLPDVELDSFVARVGIHQEQPNDPFTRRGKHYAQIGLYLTPEVQRKRKASEIIGYLKGKTNEEKPFYLSNYFQLGQKKPLVMITNDEKVRFYNNNLTKPDLELKVSDEYLLGGGFSKSGKLYTFNANNQLIQVDYQKQKVVATKQIELRTFYAVKNFYVLPDTEKGLLVSEGPSGRNYLDQVNLEDGELETVNYYRSSITSIRINGKRKEFYIATDKGSVDIYSYTLGSGLIEVKKSLTTGPRIKKKENLEIEINKTKTHDLARIEDISIGEQENENTLLLSSFEGYVYEYDLDQFEYKNIYNLNGESVLWSARHPQFKNLIIASQDTKVLVFDVISKKVVFEKPIAGVIRKLFANSNSVTLMGTYQGIYNLKTKFSQGKYSFTYKQIQKGHRNLIKTEFKETSGGPPVGAPVQIEVRGDNYKEIREVAQIAKKHLSTIEGVYDIRDNWEDGENEMHLTMSDAQNKRAAQAGISTLQIAQTLMTAFDGNVSTSIKKADEEIDIRVIFPDRLRNHLSSLSKVKIRNKIGNLVPITALASFKRLKGVSVLTHSAYRRTIYVKANIDDRKNSSLAVNTEMLKIMKEEMKKYPGLDLFAGGEHEDTQESFNDLGKAAAFAIVGIFCILLLLFSNLRQPRVILSAIPLGLIGVSLAFFFHKSFQPNLVFSFLATMGIIGLSGVVVNDSIVLVDFINKLRRLGLSKHDAIVEGCQARLRAVLLTTVTTSAGLLPTAYGLGGDDPFLKPMALAMAWGLIFATLITLIIIPAYYAVWEERGFVFHHVVSKKFKKLEGTN